MKVNKILLSILFLFLFVFSVSAQSTIQTLGTYKQNDCVNIIQICSSCTYNNISTVISPNSTILLPQTTMEKTGTFYNRTFCNTTQLGRYIVNGFGDVSGIVTVWSYDFYITASGRQLTISDSVLSGILFLAIIVLSVISFFLAVVFNTNKSRFVGIFFLALGVLLVVVDFGYVLNIINNYSENFGYSGGLFTNIYVLLTILVSAGAIAIMLYLIVYAFQSFSKIRYGEVMR